MTLLGWMFELHLPVNTVRCIHLYNTEVDSFLVGNENILAPRRSRTNKITLHAFAHFSFFIHLLTAQSQKNIAPGNTSLGPNLCVQFFIHYDSRSCLYRNPLYIPSLYNFAQCRSSVAGDKPTGFGGISAPQRKRVLHFLYPENYFQRWRNLNMSSLPAYTMQSQRIYIQIPPLYLFRINQRNFSFLFFFFKVALHNILIFTYTLVTSYVLLCICKWNGHINVVDGRKKLILLHVTATCAHALRTVCIAHMLQMYFK